MKLFESEIGEYLFPIIERNIRVLAALRITPYGYNQLESFVLLKKIQ